MQWLLKHHAPSVSTTGRLIDWKNNLRLIAQNCAKYCEHFFEIFSYTEREECTDPACPIPPVSSLTWMRKQHCKVFLFDVIEIFEDCLVNNLLLFFNTFPSDIPPGKSLPVKDLGWNKAFLKTYNRLLFQMIGKKSTDNFLKQRGCLAFPATLGLSNSLAILP